MGQPAIFIRLSKKDDHREELVYILTELRRAGQLSRMMRDGLRLIWDLSCGNLDVLLELFPSIKDRFSPPPDDKLKHEIEEIKRLILEQQAHGIPPSQTGYTMTSTPSTGKLIGGGVSLALPRFDDDDDDLPTLITAKNASVDAGMNLLKQLSGIH